MFRSFEHEVVYGSGYEFKIIDSDFTVVVRGDDSIVALALVKEYARRNLPVGKNLALLCLYFESLRRDIENILYWQDLYCSGKVENWAEIAAERNHYLDKLWAMK